MAEGIENRGWFKTKDRIGERHGYYVIVDGTDRKNERGSRIWIAKCDCGQVFEIPSDRIRSRKSCGCRAIKNSGMKQSEDIKGKIVRDIEAIRRLNKRMQTYTVWVGRCLYCGKEREYPSYYFKRGICSCDCEGWREKHQKDIGRKPIPDGMAHTNDHYHKYKRSAEERGLAFELSIEEFREITKMDCFYCGEKPSNGHTSSNLAGDYCCNGIDRADNQKGYIKENCLPCCGRCNRAKNVMGKTEFIDWINKVYENIHKGEVR